MPKLSKKPISSNPFTPSGRRMRADQLPHQPAKKILLTNKATQTLLAKAFRWVGEEETFFPTEEISDDIDSFCDVENAIQVLVAQVALLKRQLAPLTSLMKMYANGAVAQGLQLTTSKVNRELHLTGGKVILFSKTEFGDYSVSAEAIMPLCPLKFFIVAGGAIIEPHGQEKLHVQVPDLYATGEDGGVGSPASGTYRSDLLAVSPATDDGAVEFYLLLGPQSEITKKEGIEQLVDPEVPNTGVGAILPLYRIISKVGHKGIMATKQVANRINNA